MHNLRQLTVGALVVACVLATEARAQDRAPRYDGRVRLQPATGETTASWQLHLSMFAADSVVLMLNAGLSRAEVRGPRVQRVGRDTSRGLVRLTVALTPTRGPRDVTLEITTVGNLQMSDEGINSLRADYVELGLDSFWFPVLAGFPDMVGKVRIELPNGLHVVSGGAVAPAKSDRGPAVSADSIQTVTISNEVPLPDFTLTAARGLRTLSSANVRAHTTTADSSLVRAMLLVAEQCAAHLRTRYAAGAPFPVVDLVLPPRSGPGYARKRFIVVPVGEWQGSPTEAKDRAATQMQFLCHELAHYWSSGAVASGPENWLNEAFAEFVAGRAVRALQGDSAFARIEAQWRTRAARAGVVWSPTATQRPDQYASYGKAPLLLAQLEQRVGAVAMERVLYAFMTRGPRTTPLVLDLMARELPREHVEWFSAALQSSGMP